MKIRVAVVLLGFASALFLPARSFAQTLEFNHFLETVGTGKTGFFRTVEVDPDDDLTIVVKETNLVSFDYRVIGFPKEPPSPAVAPAAAGGPNRDELGTKTITTTHSGKYGGYVLTISRQPGQTLSVATGKGPDGAWGGGDDVWGAFPAEVQVVISVQSDPVRVGFAGGFIGSGLTSPRYSLGPADDDGMMEVIKDDEAEDDVSLGVASFVHVYKQGFPFALSFGLGLSSDTNASYFAGVSWRLGDKAFLSIGGAFGPTARLPNGLNALEKTPAQPAFTMDTNALNDLPTRTSASIFLGLSYTFIGGAQDALKKPFKADEDS